MSQSTSISVGAMFVIDVLKVIGRSDRLFESELQRLSERIKEVVPCNAFLVLGRIDSIGRAVTKELYCRALKNSI